MTRTVSAWIDAWSPLSSLPGMGSTSSDSSSSSNTDGGDGSNADGKEGGSRDGKEDSMAEVNAMAWSMKPDIINYMRKGDATTDAELATLQRKVCVFLCPFSFGFEA